MKRHLLTLLLALLNTLCAEEPHLLVQESFDAELSKDWFWGLGTWTAKEGVLRGFESGPRRHGPVKMRKLPPAASIVECEFRLEGGATFAGIIFNGSEERGQIVHVVMSKDALSILTHPVPGEKTELLKQPHMLAVGEWHRVRIVFQGSGMTVSLDDKTFTAQQDCLAEEKLNFGLGGDSGGPLGEKVGALEFRRLRIGRTSSGEQQKNDLILKLDSSKSSLKE